MLPGDGFVAHSMPVLLSGNSRRKPLLLGLRTRHRFAFSAPHAGRAAPPLPNVGRLISSDSVPVGGFTPGAILADRYRIVGLLGRGGMGEVYRADDLKLGQPVALKFLPKKFGSDPVRRERFFAEVRITRQLAHPNICRVYDIAEFDGQHFLSMEYIDGEDLASLIKRIGYFSSEKGLEIARQLAAGLAAAHDRGVLHRDLKPANIMIDGHGRVRITDFGLAIAAGDETQAAEVFGTPAYMAPEQFAGKGASARSDIYSLGLILYEIFSGKRAFTATTIAELRQQKDGKTPTAPSEIRDGLDPIVERLIMRCLGSGSARTPGSVTQLAAALPGGDPLAAAIAAGETPSPEMVAASGLKEGLRPALAFGLLAFVIAGAFAAMLMKDRTDLMQLDPSVKPRDFLVERAREIIRKSGYSTEGGDSAFGFDVDLDQLDYLQDSSNVPDRSQQRDRVQAVFFWYRASPRPLEHVAAIVTDHVTASDPPCVFRARHWSVWIVRVFCGLLRRFPLSETPHRNQVPYTDWTVLFSEAGLQHSEWAQAESQWTPAYYADTRAAWQGSFSGSPSIPIAIEAAAYRGKPVSFQIIGPWNRANRLAPAAVQSGERIVNGILVLLSVDPDGGWFVLCAKESSAGPRRPPRSNAAGRFLCCHFDHFVDFRGAPRPDILGNLFGRPRIYRLGFVRLYHSLDYLYCARTVCAPPMAPGAVFMDAPVVGGVARSSGWA